MSRKKKKLGLGLGVRKHNSTMCYNVSKEKNIGVLLYSRPCLCGSLKHKSTRHLGCPLNPRYDDAYEYNQ